MKRKFILYILFLAATNTGFAESSSLNTEQSEKSESFVQAMKKGEKKAQSEFSKLIMGSTGKSKSTTSSKLKEYPSFYKNRPKTSDEEINELLEEVQTLKSKVVHTKQYALSTQTLRKGKSIGTKTYFNYQEGKIYEIHAGVDRITDIELQTSERLTHAPLAGDTVRWKLSALTSGKGADEKTHLILKPLEENIETNIVIPTTKRVYHIRAISNDWYMPSVAWNYPDEQAANIEEHIRRGREVEPISIAPENLSFSYRIEGKHYSWQPLRVFDDGAKTYFQMPAEMSATEAPVLFIMDENGEPALVNYRVKGAYYIVDRLITRAQMRVGKKGIVDIYSHKYKKSLWDRLF